MTTYQLPQNKILFFVEKKRMYKIQLGVSTFEDLAHYVCFFYIQYIWLFV